MADYNLAGLSTRSFEQLIQAIAAKLLGPGLVVFGDGPDGAREATFEGRAQYPSASDPWEGYIVVQAKFLQRPKDSTADGAWAIRQLDAELKKFLSRKRSLRRPEYYIFCTNVVLTAAYKSGSKDRANNVLESYRRRLKMKGCAIWDYDQIRASLDNLPAIHQTYAAWITPGDVLAQAIQWIRPARADFETVMVNFLQKELLADQFVNLEQAGHAAEERTPMAKVFIDLPVAAQPTFDPPAEKLDKGQLPLGFVQELLVAGSQRLSPSEMEISRMRTAQGEKEPLPGRFVLIGGPGQGKTTVSQFACQMFRASILLCSRSTLLSPEVRNILEMIKQHCDQDKTELPRCRRFPIRVVLNQFAHEVASKEPGRPKSLLSYIVERIRIRTAQNVTADDLRSWLKA